MFRLLMIVAILCMGRSVTAATELGVEGTRFTVNGQPTFLLGMSYYGALGASREFIQQDLDDMQESGFNWIRVWATWAAFDSNVSTVDEQGNLRQPFFDHLKWLLAECDRRGMMVDVTLSSGESVIRAGGPATLEAHRRAAVALTTELKPFRNWYLDVANENNAFRIDKKSGKISFRFGRGKTTKTIPFKDLRQLISAVKNVDSARLVTVSFGGGDEFTEEGLREYMKEVRVDFLTPHRRRRRGEPEKVASGTRNTLALMEKIEHVVPVHYQEPFRRGFRPEWWIPKAGDFVIHLQGAIAGGAAGWCFHNGDNRATDAVARQPRRSFDMREKRLFEQFDEEERQAIRVIRRLMTRAEAQ